MDRCHGSIRLTVNEARELIEAGNELAELLEGQHPPDPARLGYALGTWETLAFEIGRRA